MPERREWLIALASGAAVALAGRAASAAPQPGAALPQDARAEAHEEEVSPAEDLMREHGVLDRLLLVYEEGARQVERQSARALSVLASAAGIIRRFIEDYHEKLEEEFVFPRLEAARREADLVAILRRQHAKGRVLTDRIQTLAALGATLGGGDRRRVVTTLGAFVRMYRPHAAREETVLFPAFHDAMEHVEYMELGEQFEEREHALFGEEGFRGIVEQVAGLERTLGIYDLARFEPV